MPILDYWISQKYTKWDGAFNEQQNKYNVRAWLRNDTYKQGDYKDAEEIIFNPTFHINKIVDKMY